MVVDSNGILRYMDERALLMLSVGRELPATPKQFFPPDRQGAYDSIIVVIFELLKLSPDFDLDTLGTEENPSQWQTMVGKTVKVQVKLRPLLGSQPMIVIFLKRYNEAINPSYIQTLHDIHWPEIMILEIRSLFFSEFYWIRKHLGGGWTAEAIAFIVTMASFSLPFNVVLAILALARIQPFD